MPKLLIVDDEVDVREFAKRFFARRNIEVITASGGHEALDIISRENPDLVLLDVRMEGMNGVDLLKTLRDQQNNTKVIMVTGVDEEEAHDAASSYGVKGYIHKPLVLEELEKIVLAELKTQDS